ncbi:hypothetical protein EII29_05660 [Leptotrichia sp. OH3620_COT-345]|uniref:hypothetical protein n=1 Tax=Leptotrichia sp. OH3620_COT-345 TaxID=2491048 RepID=UPI000F653223|nr:hypothetical protein [Leptotrichia sp. OH3620_COT-345]RRD39746.1 hypothetical protein EII29_05660 [Leptotrichia sp. OH3620_COT-345]
MKKIILICLFLITALTFTIPSKDSRGVLIMSENEWFEMFGDNAKTDGKCSYIGALVMQMAYISEGKIKNHTIEEASNNLAGLNAHLYKEGLRHPSNDNSLLFEYYYVKNCRKLTGKDFDLIGSPSFKSVFNEIYNIYK